MKNQKNQYPNNPYPNINSKMLANQLEYQKVIQENKNLPIQIDDLIEDQPIDDNYLILLHQKLRLMKEQRKQCEHDEDILNGRVNYLKNEQEKAIKKIELTKKKTLEKVIAKEQQDLEFKEKMKIKNERERQIEELKQKNLAERVRSINTIISKKNEQIQNNLEELHMMKETRKQNEEIVKNLKDEEINKKKDFAEYIKNQQFVRIEKKKAADIEKKNALKIELEKKIEMELRIKSENDQEIELLTQTESELINRINDIRVMHKQLIEDFQRIFYGNNDFNNDGSSSNINVNINNNEENNFNNVDG